MNENRNPILLGQAEVMDLVRPDVRAMLDTEGLYVGGDSKHPGVVVPLSSMGGRVFSMKIDEELDPARFLPTLTLHGPYYAEAPAPAPPAGVARGVTEELADFVTRVPQDRMHQRLLELGWTPPSTKSETWLPMTSAPRDGTMLRLLVVFTDNATEDTAGACATIGANSFDASGDDEWKLAGWNWQQDCFTQGEGRPVGWLPMIEDAPQHPDDVAVDRFATAMKEKLADARAKGRGGWQDKVDCPQQRLSDMLRAHLEKGDPRDVANFCMFLHQRGESILQATDAHQWRGIFKLVEECGEVLQVLGKIGPFPSGDHPDGMGNLKDRITDELGDLAAAGVYFGDTNGLDADRGLDRRDAKLAKFRQWGLTGLVPPQAEA